jgi:hypothetical protein
MTATTASAATALARPGAPGRPRGLATWATLAGRRISLSAHTPREILAPLATPLLFALAGGFTSTTTDAALSLLVLGAWAIVVTAAAIRVFTRSAVT